MTSSSTLNNLQVNKLQTNELIVTGETPKFTMKDFDMLKNILKEGILQEKVLKDTTSTIIQSSGIEITSHIGLSKIRCVRITKLHKQGEEPLDVYSYRTYKFNSHSGQIFYYKYIVDTKNNYLGNTKGRIIKLTENSFTVEWVGHRYSLNKTIYMGITKVERDGENLTSSIYDSSTISLKLTEYKPVNLFKLL